MQYPEVGRVVLHGIARRIRSLYAAAGILLSAALALAVLALWGLAALTEEVLEGDTARFDRAVLLWLNEHATPGLDRVAIQVTALGDNLVVVVLAVVAAALLRLSGEKAYAALIVLAVGGAGVLTPVLKLVFDRPRPTVFEVRAHYEVSTAAYPSGHATMSMVVLLAVAFVIHRLAARAWVGVLALTLAGVLVLLIGLSRLYLGVHHPSDVVAGLAIGFAWTVACAVTVEALGQRRGRRDRERA